MSTLSLLSILVPPQSGYLLVYHMGLSLVHCSYLSIGLLQISIAGGEGDMVRAYLLLFFFIFPFFFCNHGFIFFGYKKPHAALAMERIKPINAK